MAIIGLPALSIYLVEHVGGGAVLHAGGGYVTNAYISASVVSAFQTAATTLAGLAGGVTAPVTGAAAAIAVVGVGSYCYFYGIPAPIEAVLAKAGFGKSAASATALVTKASSGAFVVSAANLASALVVLGLAGYVGYRFYQHHADAAQAAADGTVIDAEAVATQSFGDRVWEQYGQPISDGLSEASGTLASFIRDAVATVGAQSEKASKSVEGAATGSLAWLVAWWNRRRGRVQHTGEVRKS